MKYFVTDNEREGTCYHEFYRGKWDGYTFWKEDSLSIHDDIMVEHEGFPDAIKEIVTLYDSAGETEISFDEWIEIGKIIQQKDETSQAIYHEADEWLKDVFKTNGCFTILGI